MTYFVDDADVAAATNKVNNKASLIGKKGIKDTAVVFACVVSPCKATYKLWGSFSCEARRVNERAKEWECAFGNGLFSDCFLPDHCMKCTAFTFKLIHTCNF